MKIKHHHLIPAALIAVSLMSLNPAARADSGYWAVDGGGNWSTTASWLNGIVADGATNTAYFTNNVTANRTVTLDTARTIGNLTIGRSGGYIGNNLAIGGSQYLTLDNSGNPPVITCFPLKSAGNSAVNFSPRLLGTSGLTKMGTGTLWLQGNSFISGNLIIAQGRVFTYLTPYALGYMNVIISNGCYLSFYVGGTYSGNNFTLNGIGQTQDAQVKSALYADNYNTVTLDSSDTITLNATSDIGTSAASGGQGAIVTINGTITGPGGLVKNGAAYPQGLLVLGNGSVADYAGPTLVSNGTFAVDTTLVNSAVTNYSGTYLAGIGFIANSATLLTNATLKPNRTNQIGTLSISNLTCATGSKLSFLLNPSDLTEGSYVNDELLVTNLVLTGGTTNLVAFQNTSSPAVGRHVIVEYITASGLTNLTLTPAFAAQAYHPGLDISVPGQVAVVISNSAITDVTWVGGNANNLWDLVSTTNWNDGVNPAVFNNGQTVHFTDTGNNASPVLLKGTLQPALVSVESSINYTFAGSGRLSGSGGFQKITGSGLLTLANATNNYTGPTMISTGTLQLGTNNIIPSGTGYGDFTLAGGTLDMNGFSQSVNDLTALTSGAVDNTSTNPCILTINDQGPDSTGGYIFHGQIMNSGGGPLTVVKTGSSMIQWSPGAGPFTYTGGTILNAGRALVLANNVFGYGDVTISNGAVVNLWGPNVTAPVTNNFWLYSVGTTWFNQLLNTITCGNVGTTVLSGTIHLMNTATLGASGAAGAVLDVSGQITGPGALQMNYPSSSGYLSILQLSNSSNNFTGGLQLYGGWLQCLANGVIPNGSGYGNVSIINPTNAAPLTPLTLLDLSGNSEEINGLSGNGVVTNSSPTPASLTVGNNNANGAFSGSIVGAVALQKVGTGTLLLDGTNTYTGGTTVSAGTLSGSGMLASAVSIQSAATLAPGDAAAGILTVNGGLTINGNLLFKLDKSSPLTNDLVVVTGSLSSAGTGTLTVTNLGPALFAGDRFVLFSQPLVNGGALSISGPVGVTFTNLLATDGSIKVLSAPTASNPTNLMFSVSGGALQLSWPADHLGWYAQSNAVGVVHSSSWFDIPGSQQETSLNIPINSALPQVYYRLRHP